MKKLITVITIFIFIQTTITITSQYLSDNLTKDVYPALRFLFLLIFTIIIMVACLYYIKRNSVVQLNYFKSFGILMLIYTPPIFLSRLFWGIVRDNFGTVDWTENIAGWIAFITFGLFITSVISIFFRKKQ